MAKLKLASSTILFFYFLSLPYALTSSNFPALDTAPWDIPHDEDNLVAFDLTEEKKETDDIPSSAPSEAIPFYRIHHHPNHQPEILMHKEIPYGNDMILSSHGNFKNLAFEEGKGFSEEDNNLRKFHHHFVDREVKGIEQKREEHAHGYWFHQLKFGGEEEHPYNQKSHQRRSHHHDHFEEKEEREGVEMMFKLRKFLH